jgi:hypothetical protein
MALAEVNDNILLDSEFKALDPEPWIKILNPKPQFLSPKPLALP